MSGAMCRLSGFRGSACYRWTEPPRIHMKLSTTVTFAHRSSATSADLQVFVLSRARCNGRKPAIQARICPQTMPSHHGSPAIGYRVATGPCCPIRYATSVA